MSSPPKKCLVDTNVPINANLATKPDQDSDVPDTCVLECIRQIQRITKNGGLVVDDAVEFFSEYINNLSLSGQGMPGTQTGSALGTPMPKSALIRLKLSRPSGTSTSDHPSLTLLNGKKPDPS